MANANKSVDTGKNSTCSAQSAPTIKGIAINKHDESPQYEWCKLYPRALCKATFSEQPEMYLVYINGSCRENYSTPTRNTTTVELLYEEIHPHLAVGHAVIDFMESKKDARIHEIEICKRTIKKQKSRKR